MTKDDSPIYQEVLCDSAAEFLSHLRVSSPTWLAPKKLVSSWVFRGQGNAQWDLKPSAWRPDGQAKLAPVMDGLRERVQSLIPRPGEIAEKYLIQVTAEQRAIVQFAEMADSLGLKIPDIELIQKVDSIMDLWMNTGSSKHERPSRAVATAQHHGVPTRLLDFTYQGPIAAFFAAESADKLSHGNHPPDSLAVWAVNWRSLEQFSAIERLHYPRTENDYMHAQDGVFLFLSNAHRYFLEHGEWPSFREIIKRTTDGSPTIRKMTLRVEHARELLRLLWAEGITRARLMPTYDNVARTLFEKWTHY